MIAIGLIVMIVTFLIAFIWFSSFSTFDEWDVILLMACGLGWWVGLIIFIVSFSHWIWTLQ